MLKTSPLQYYNSIKPKSLADVFNSPTCSIVRLRGEIGEMKTLALLVYMITDVVEQLNVGKTMNDKQVGRAAELIADEFYYLKPDDFKLCFDNAVKGRYGATYDRIDIQIICSWLNKYTGERMDEADNTSYQQHLSEKKTEISPKVIEHLTKNNEARTENMDNLRDCRRSKV